VGQKSEDHIFHKPHSKYEHCSYLRQYLTFTKIYPITAWSALVVDTTWAVRIKIRKNNDV